MSDKKQNKMRNQFWIYLLSILLVFLFLLWKCRYGFGNRDESFYLTIPYRLYQGDSLFAQEWHLSQMSSILLLPFFYAYMFIKGSTTGIILDFRYLFVCIQGIASVFLYLRLRKYSWLGAYVASIAFFLYAPFGIMALSYNSMGILTLTLSVTLFWTNENANRWEYFVAGFFFAAAVLCCPYLILVYMLYGILVFIKCISHSNKKKIGWNVSIKTWFCFSVGSASLAVVFAVFVFSRASLKQMLEAFPMIMNDPEHRFRSVYAVIRSYVLEIINCSDSSKIILLGFLLLWCMLMIDKKCQKCNLYARSRNDEYIWHIYPFKHRQETSNSSLTVKRLRKWKFPSRSIYFIAAIILTVILMLPFLTYKKYLNYVMFPLNLLAAYCYFLTEKKKIKQMFLMGWIPGMLYSFCLHLSSNQYFYAISSASTVALVNSILIIILTAKEILGEEKSKIKVKCTVLLTISLMIMQLGSEVFLRYSSVFWENSMSEQICLLEEGVEQGLLVTPQKKQYYLSMTKDVQSIEENNQIKSVLFISKNTWLYLGSSKRMASYSAWLAGINAHTRERLEHYFDFNPDKIPDAIYIEASYADFSDWLCEEYDYQESQTELGNLLLQRN